MFMTVFCHVDDAEAAVGFSAVAPQIRGICPDAKQAAKGPAPHTQTERYKNKQARLVVKGLLDGGSPDSNHESNKTGLWA